MDPVIVAQVRSDQPPGVLAMAGFAVAHEDLSAPGDDHRILGRFERVDAGLEFAHRRRLDRRAFLHFLPVLRLHQVAGVQHVKIGHVTNREHNAAVKQPHPPPGEFVVEFANAIGFVVEEQGVFLVSHGVDPGGWLKSRVGRIRSRARSAALPLSSGNSS